MKKYKADNLRADKKELEALKAGNKAIGSWLSAALDDDLACDEFKSDIRFWFDQQRLDTIKDDLEEWEHHVSISGLRASKAYCGIDIEYSEFYMVSSDHATACVKQETRVQPCPKCWEVIQKNHAPIRHKVGLSESKTTKGNLTLNKGDSIDLVLPSELPNNDINLKA